MFGTDTSNELLSAVWWTRKSFSRPRGNGDSSQGPHASPCCCHPGPQFPFVRPRSADASVDAVLPQLGFIVMRTFEPSPPVPNSRGRPGPGRTAGRFLLPHGHDSLSTTELTRTLILGAQREYDQGQTFASALLPLPIKNQNTFCSMASYISSLIYAMGLFSLTG